MVGIFTPFHSHHRTGLTLMPHPRYRGETKQENDAMIALGQITNREQDGIRTQGIWLHAPQGTVGVTGYWHPCLAFLLFFTRQTCPEQQGHKQCWPCWEGRPDRLDWTGLKNSPAGPHGDDGDSGDGRGPEGEVISGLQQAVPPRLVCVTLLRRPPALRWSPPPHSGLKWAARVWARAAYFSPCGSRNM